jgi:hypothetical protein
MISHYSIRRAAGAMSETVLRTIDLTKRYKNRLAVDHLNGGVMSSDFWVLTAREKAPPSG